MAQWIKTLDSAAWGVGLWIDLALKGVLMLVMAGGLAWLLRGRSAALRHAVWLAALTSLLALPVLSALLPAWRQLGQVGGAYLGHDAPGPVEIVDGWRVVHVPVRWERNRLDLRVVFDAQGRVDGLWTFPPRAGLQEVSGRIAS